jgi:hypothetical protein
MPNMEQRHSSLRIKNLYLYPQIQGEPQKFLKRKTSLIEGYIFIQVDIEASPFP